MFFRIFIFLLLVTRKSTLETAEPEESFYFNLTDFSDNGTFSAARDSKSGEISIDQEDDEDQSEKIYGGSIASLGQFPFMSIVHRLAGYGKYFVCGGSILSKRWVLTAGHCVANHPRKFFVVFGVVDKSRLGYDHLTGEGVSMIATQGALHTDYGLGRHDIALLYMPKDIPFSDTIQPIRIAGRSFRDESFSATPGHIYGWGKVGNSGSSVQRLMYGRVVIISNRECRSAWNVDRGQVCTESSLSQDVCQGDSGGPLVILEDNDEPLQIGIVSYGTIGCPSDRPAVFTRVSSYALWIEKVTRIKYE